MIKPGSRVRYIQTPAGAGKAGRELGATVVNTTTKRIVIRVDGDTRLRNVNYTSVAPPAPKRERDRSDDRPRRWRMQ